MSSDTSFDSVRILVVDDDPFILELYREVLSVTHDFCRATLPIHGRMVQPVDDTWVGAGIASFEVHACNQGDQAIKAVRAAIREGRPFAVAFVDVVMPPGQDGVQTAREIRALDPHLEIVIVTGHSGIDSQEIACRVQPVHKLLYVRKPFHPQEIQHFASALAAKWHGENELRKIHTELEARVEQRNLELLKVNTQLQRDIARRQQAEKELQHTLSKLRGSMGGIIQAMALTVETRDPYTAGHQRRVADLARGIGEEMGLSIDEIDGIRMAGVIHDLGKISVPAEILSRPGVLNEIEFSFIKGHPQVGYDILKEIQFPWPVAQIVLQHHERMDGSGYPSGLSGQDILLEARILAVADVVEAMASHRPYRPAVGIDKAMEEIAMNRGILYDPDAVDACVRLCTEKGFQFRR